MTAELIDVNGGHLAVISAGHGGEPLMLVHGFTGAKEDFADELGHFADLGFWAVSPDLRGHGASHQPDDEDHYSLAIFATDVFGLADALGWERFHLVGHSMGGMVAQLMVLERAERIGSLVLMDTHHGVLSDLDRGLITLGQELARSDGLEVIQSILKLGRDPLANPAYERLCDERPGYREWAESKMLACSPAMYAAMLGELAGVPDRLDRLRSIAVPTLAVVGEHDAAFVDATRAMAEVMQAARYSELVGGGHSPQFEATEAWRDVVHAFLLDVAGPPSATDRPVVPSRS